MTEFSALRLFTALNKRWLLLPLLVICVASIALLLSGANKLSNINDIRLWHAPDRSRIVFDLDKNTHFNGFSLQNPSRLVVDLTGAKLNATFPAKLDLGQFVKTMRIGTPNATVKRLVFDLKKPIRYVIKLLKPSGKYKYRLVVDIYDRNADDETLITYSGSAKSARRVDTPAIETVEPAKVAQPKPSNPPSKSDKILVVVDPGHGGDDPGALGKYSNEKTLVLKIAKEVVKEINSRSNLHAILTRNADYYIPLRGRTRISREKNADLFVSIHADAFKNPKARGASVYALSQRGATSETAKWLAQKENAADLAGGINLGDKDALLAEVLLDLSMTKTVNESLRFGDDILGELKKIGKVHSKRVEQAAFVVLKSPDIPSVLVETAYITNPTEEKLLNSKKHRKRIAKAVANGIERYVKSTPGFNRG